MILFIENLAGLYIASHSKALADRWSIKLVSRSIRAYASPELAGRGPVIFLSVTLMRILKPLFGVAQLPVVLQDPNGIAFRLSAWKLILSDGLLTEFLVVRLGVRVRRFYSLRDVDCGVAEVRSGCAIVGSNWLEHGSMLAGAYQHHLEFLRDRFPGAVYYCHPRERSSIPEQVFGVQLVRRLELPLEAHLWRHGVPATLVGVCSSSLFNLALGCGGRVSIELVVVPSQEFDGTCSDTIETLRATIQGRKRICVADIQSFLREALELQRVTVNLCMQPPR